VGEPLTGHHGRVRALTALPGEDGRTVLVSGGNDGTVRLWDLASGTQIGGTRTDHQAPVWGLAAVPQGTSVSLASAGDDETIRFWSTNGRTDSWRVMRSRTGWLLSFTTVTVGGQPWLITGSTDGEVRLWRPERVTRATERTSFTVHHGPVRALTAMPWPGGRAIVAVGDDDGTVSLWDVTNGRNLGRKSRTHTGRVQALAHVPGPGGASLVASAGEDGVVKFWTLDSGTLFGVLHVELGEISAVLAVGQGRVALGTSEGVCVLDVPWLAS
jgi:WD40 repeat protein